jgi:hypothetical protein
MAQGNHAAVELEEFATFIIYVVLLLLLLQETPCINVTQ